MKSAVEERKSRLGWGIRAASAMVCPEEVFLRRGHLSKDKKEGEEGVV